MRGMRLHTWNGLGIVREAAAVTARAGPSGELMAGRAALRLRCPVINSVGVVGEPAAIATRACPTHKVVTGA